MWNEIVHFDENCIIVKLLLKFKQTKSFHFVVNTVAVKFLLQLAIFVSTLQALNSMYIQ